MIRSLFLLIVMRVIRICVDIGVKLIFIRIRVNVSFILELSE
mgnify:CR=1 FL=1